MANQLQIRRGTAAQNDVFTGADGELSVDTDTRQVRVHDASLAGGYKMARAAFATVAALLASMEVSWPAGYMVQAGDHYYVAAPTSATDHHLTQGGGVKLYVMQEAGGYRAEAFGAIGDGVKLSAGAITATATTYVDSGAAFTAADVGKLIQVEGAGASGAKLVTTIASYTSATTVELTDAAATTVTGADASYWTDSTTAIQGAINAASYTGGRAVVIGAGYFGVDVLRVFYDAADNPGYNASTTPRRHGKITMTGQGTLDISNIRTYEPTYGTILECTGSGLIVSSVAEGHGSSPYPARAFSMAGITLVANSSGYVMEVASCPEMTLFNCLFYQRNAAGNGVLAKSSWYMVADNVRVFGVSGATGIGWTAGSDLFSGQYKITNGLIDTWTDGFVWDGGQMTNVVLDHMALQNCTQYGIHGSSGSMDQLILREPYFEGTSRTVDIKGTGTVVQQLIIRGGFALSGDEEVSYLSDKVIDLANPHSVHITGFKNLRLYKPFLNVTAVSNGGAVSGYVADLKFQNDVGHVWTGTAFALFTGILPTFGPGIVWQDYDGGYTNGTAGPVKLFDSATVYPAELHDRRTGVSSLAQLAMGPMSTYASHSSAITIAPGDPVSVIQVEVATGAGVGLKLPNQSYMLGGRVYVAYCDSASTGNLVVQNASDSSGVLTLEPGQSGMVIFDQATKKYIPFCGLTARQSAIAALTDSSGGTAGSTLTAVSGSGADPAINNAVATLAAQIEALRVAVQAFGVIASP